MLIKLFVPFLIICLEDGSTYVKFSYTDKIICQWLVYGPCPHQLVDEKELVDFISFYLLSAGGLSKYVMRLSKYQKSLNIQE